MRRALLSFLVILSLIPITGARAAWQGDIPKVAQSPEKWKLLLEELVDDKMHYGSLAASTRILTFFTDLALKELSYQTIISLIDQGYPYSTRQVFVTGDIEPDSSDNFSNSYNLYKGLIARDKGMSKWAEHYFANVDKENFPKYLFYTALDAYAAKDTDMAMKTLKKILSLDLGADQAALTKKVARTLGRLHFELEQYDKSFDVYDNFLLRTNPITPADWLESAWNLYYLKKYDQALGMLYNLESDSAGELINLEKYVVRGLIYQKMCETGRMEALLKTFDTDFGKTIYAIKSGESLDDQMQLRNLYHPKNIDYYQTQTSIERLQEEQTRVGSLPRKVRELANYLYKSEISMLQRKYSSYTEQAMTHAATHLINLSEGLRFLKFDVSREKFNPDNVFQAADAKDKSRVVPQEAGFQIRWIQLGDYWRDERPEYRGILKNKCAIQ